MRINQPKGRHEADETEGTGGRKEEDEGENDGVEDDNK